MIYKLQRSLLTNEQKPRLLVCNEDKSHFHEFDLEDDVKKLFGNEYKVFVNGEIEDDGLMHFDSEILEDQGW